MDIRRWGTSVLLALFLTGCAAEEPTAVVAKPTPTATSAASPPASTPSSPRPSCVPAFAANTLVDTDSPAGGILGLQAATSAVHTGYDRVVFTFGGSAQPGWRAEYVASPTSDGSGDPVAVQGGRALQVILRDVGYPADTGVPDPVTRRFTPAGATVVREVVLDALYEGQYTAFIGVDTTRPFRVFRLAGPPRVVVDVRHC